MKWVLAKSRSASPANATDPNSTVYGPRCERMVSVCGLTVIDSDTGKTSIGRDLLPGDEAIGAAREKSDRAGDFFLGAHSPQRHRGNRLRPFVLVQILPRQLGIDDSRRQRIDKNIGLRIVQRHRPRQAGKTGLP